MLASKIKSEINNFSPELKLSILLAVKEIGRIEEKCIKDLLQETLDWNLFLAIVKQNRTYPIVYKNISKIQNVTIPEYVLNKLHKLALINTMNSLKFIRELIRIVDVFNKNDIGAISLKGPLLGRSIYGDVALRAYRDLDILVDIKDIEKVDEILLESGYKRDYPDISLSVKQRKAFIKTNHHFEYHHDKLNLHLEIHWKYYFSNSSLDFQEIWEKREETSISGYEIATLEAEENFLYLVFHGAKHGWFRLRWLCDVYEIIKSNQLDWESIKRKAEQLKIFHMVLQCMLLVKFLFGLDVPYEINENIKNNRRGYKLVEMAIPFIKTIEQEQTSKKIYLYMNNKKYMFKLFYGIKNKMRIILQHFYPILQDFKTIQLSDSMFPLYFILRPFLWLYRLGTDICKRLL